MVDFKICLAEVEDTELLVKHRLSMWVDMIPELKKQVQESEELTGSWIKKKLSEGALIGFIARTQTGIVAGSGCLWIREEQPRFTNTCLQAPYLMSMYTEKTFRRRGVASKIVKEAIDWSREHCYNTIYLHASEVGSLLYPTFGFKTTTEMRLML
jgi:GNAT superfamily N-acetyltransferase